MELTKRNETSLAGLLPFWQLVLATCFLASTILSGIAVAGDEISTVDFETIPPGTRLVAPQVTLDADTQVNGSVQASGEVITLTGVRFSDGTLQTSAPSVSEVESLTANQGLYSNRVPAMTPNLAYTEICFVDGSMAFDLHEGGESTTGGNCEPGDLGWIIERSEREGGDDLTWSDARLGCLLDGMRLPEPFEWQVACDHEATLGLSGFTSGAEWASNFVAGSSLSDNAGPAVVVLGESGGTNGGQGCNFGGHGFLARVMFGTRNQHQYRCVR